jgi:2-methylcitrate dehydratase PrpD
MGANTEEEMAADTMLAATTAPDFAQIYAEFSSLLSFQELSPDVLAAARLNIFDTLACSIAGFTATGIPELRNIAQDWGGKPEASVLWSNVRVPVPHAAWVNGSMSHARDYDDTHDLAVLHAGVSVIPAAIAAAEIAGRPVSGKDFYAAVVAGLELICRLGVATGLGAIESGFIYTSLLGYFAATAAVARVLDFSAEDTVNALGIVLAQAAGSHQATRDAAWTKRMQPGFAARAAMTSVTMTRHGVRGARLVFEGIDGVNRIYLQSTLDSEAARKGLGSHYHFVDLSYKPYPCCRFNHTAIDAAILLRASRASTGETSLKSAPIPMCRAIRRSARRWRSAARRPPWYRRSSASAIPSPAYW